MDRRRVPKGSVGRVILDRELKQREVPCPLKKRKLEECPTICCGALQPAATLAEARTEVGVALSTKEMRTHWEVCAEGKHVRDQWDADFEATVQWNEKEAADYWDGLSKKQRDLQRAWRLGEQRNMKRGDRESKIYKAIDDMHEQLAIPPALFKCGQSVLQWWASWMKNALETPKTYNKKNRPWWFSAEITSYVRYGEIKYAGQTVTDHLYHVY